MHAAYGDRLASLDGRSAARTGTTTADAPAARCPVRRPEFFFAPTQIAKRSADWGRAELDRRTAEAWTAYSAWTDGWLEPGMRVGPDAVGAAYAELLAGGTDPRTGYVCALPADGPAR